MVGTEKQIAWAGEIVAQWHAAIEAQVAAASDDGESAARWAPVHAFIDAINSAKSVIDWRSATINTLRRTMQIADAKNISYTSIVEPRGLAVWNILNNK